MLIAQDGSGLVFCVDEQIASLSPAFPNRWRAVLAGGTVAYLPGDKPDGPWLPSGKDWVCRNSCVRPPRGGKIRPASPTPPPSWHLRRARPRLYFNPRRLRRIPILPNGSAAIVYDNGRQHTLERQFHQELCQTLGLKSLTHLEPFVPGLFRNYLRDFPFELARAPAEVLKHYFATSDELTANLIWQARHDNSWAWRWATERTTAASVTFR